jgi:tetratricopeptide (TPR) repeat protein
MHNEPSPAAPVPDSGNCIGNLAAGVDSARLRKPWYRHPSTLIALMALIFSIGIVFVSSRSAQAQGAHAAQKQSGKGEMAGKSSPDASSSASNQSTGNIVARVDLMQHDIDGLRAALAGQTKPWYRDASTLIAMMALLFSFGTTFVSYHRTEVQDIQAARQELRGILQRLSAIPREEIAASKQYAGDANTIFAISQLDNQENSILVRQALEIARKLPRNMVSATEHYAIAYAQQHAYDLLGAKESIRLATERATNFNDEIAAIRSGAYLDFLTGDYPEGRARFEQALNIFAKFPDYDPYTKISTSISTELAWGSSEAGIGQFSLALQHTGQAQKLVDTLPQSPGSDGLRQQIASCKQIIETALSSGGSVPPVPFPSAPPH